MKIEDIINATDGLSDDQRIATAKLIDIKVESEMKQFLAEIKNEFKALDSRFTEQDNRFEEIHNILRVHNKRFDAIDDRFDKMDSRITNQFQTVYSVVGLVGLFLSILLTILTLYK
mgnify:CR=1 FL=1